MDLVRETLRAAVNQNEFGILAVELSRQHPVVEQGAGATVPVAALATGQPGATISVTSYSDPCFAIIASNIAFGIRLTWTAP